MDAQHLFERLKKRYSLKDADFYFLDLLPLIKIIWADGRNQEEELKILCHFLIEHIAYLDKKLRLPIITTNQANDFLDRFAYKKPSNELLDDLENLFLTLGITPLRPQSTLDYCLDIAAACSSHPFGMHDRVIKEEKILLQKIFKELSISL